MQVPSILQGGSRTRLLQGIATGAVASVVIGFSWGGWMTGGTADRLAAERADTAVVATARDRVGARSGSALQEPARGNDRKRS
jgi:hypothetical protein